MTAGTVVALLLAGCGGDGGAVEAEPGTPSPSASQSEAGQPSESPGSTVQPADGARVTMGSLDLRLPRGFPPRRINDGLVTATGPEFERIVVTARGSVDDNSLDELVEISRAVAMWERPPRRAEDVEVDGELMYHLVGPERTGYYGDEFGAEVNGWDVTLKVLSTGPGRKRTEIARSVLASIQWGE